MVAAAPRLRISWCSPCRSNRAARTSLPLTTPMDPVMAPGSAMIRFGPQAAEEPRAPAPRRALVGAEGPGERARPRRLPAEQRQRHGELAALPGYDGAAQRDHGDGVLQRGPAVGRREAPPRQGPRLEDRLAPGRR